MHLAHTGSQKISQTVSNASFSIYSLTTSAFSLSFIAHFFFLKTMVTFASLPSPLSPHLPPLAPHPSKLSLCLSICLALYIHSHILRPCQVDLAFREFLRMELSNTNNVTIYLVFQTLLHFFIHHCFLCSQYLFLLLTMSALPQSVNQFTHCIVQSQGRSLNFNSRFLSPIEIAPSSVYTQQFLREFLYALKNLNSPCYRSDCLVLLYASRLIFLLTDIYDAPTACQGLRLKQKIQQ